MPESDRKDIIDKIEKSRNDDVSGQMNETINKNGVVSKKMVDFAKFAMKELKINKSPKIKINSSVLEGSGVSSFGGYDPSSETITITIGGRHLMDIFRTLAHEMTHHKQNVNGELKDITYDGMDGSPIENEANSTAGIIMRKWARLNPNFNEGVGMLNNNTDTEVEEPITKPATKPIDKPNQPKRTVDLPFIKPNLPIPNIKPKASI